jgi:hypothetical protein
MSLTYATLLQRYFKMNEDHLADTLKGFATQEKVHPHPNSNNLLGNQNLGELLRDDPRRGNRPLYPQEASSLDDRGTFLEISSYLQVCNDLKVGYMAKQRSIILLDIVLSKLKIHKHYLQLLAITIILMMIKVTFPSSS